MTAKDDVGQLRERAGPGRRALTVLLGCASRDANGADDVTADDEGHPAFDGNCALYPQHAQANAATGERVLKRLCRALESGRRL
jgi:hypothetical protein